VKRADLRGRCCVRLKKRNRKAPEPRSGVGKASMAKQKKLRGINPRPPKPKESGHWKPALWDTETVGRHLRRAIRCAAKESELFLGPHEGRIIAAGIHSQMKEVQSVAMLKRMGIQTIGEAQAQP
jgi:hypothetical protein